MNEKLYSEKDEIYLLGACMNDPAILQDCIEKVPAAAFYVKEHFELFKLLKQMFRMKILTSAEMIIKFARDNEIKIISEKLVVNICMIAGLSIDTKYYLERILSLYTQRSVYKVGEDILLNVPSSKDIKTLKKQYIEKLEDLDGNETKGFVSFQNLFSDFREGMNYIEYLDDLMEKRKKGLDTFTGYRTGYNQLDSLIGGFENGTSTIIGARSSSGKTTFITNLIIKIINENPDAVVGFFSLEMNMRRIFEKILYTAAGVKYSNDRGYVYTPQEYTALCHIGNKIQSWPIFQYDHPGIKVSQIKSEIKKAIARNKINICFIDYLTKIQADYRGTNKHMEIDQVSKGIQECAQEFNIPMITLAQLNRQVMGRQDKRPVMADLRESGSIEEDADTILLLHRPKHYDDKLKEDLTELYVAKNRTYGDLGKITFSFEKGVLNELPSIEEMVQGTMMVPQDEKENMEAWKKRYVARDE